MDNHANVDLARTIFDLGAGFWDLVHASRCAALNAAGERGVPLLVMTFCYAEPDDRAKYSEFEAITRGHGGTLLPAFLHCSREEAARRIGNPDRVERRKLTSAEILFRELDRYNYTSVPRDDCIKMDTGVTPAEDTAKEIVRCFRLTEAA
jgi:hypothetical protein